VLDEPRRHPRRHGFGLLHHDAPGDRVVSVHCGRCLGELAGTVPETLTGRLVEVGQPVVVAGVTLQQVVERVLVGEQVDQLVGQRG
jgi:hypothetical protein